MRIVQSSPRPARDQGSVLPLALVITVVMGMVVIAIATYSTTSLRFGHVAENRSDQLSAADAGMRYAIDQLKLRNAACILDTQEAVLPGVDADFNGASAWVVCERITSGYEGIQAYAAVMTGEGVPADQELISTQAGNSQPKILGGPVYMSRIDASAFALGPQVTIENGPLLYHDGSGDTSQPCTSLKPSQVPAVAADKLVFDPELIFGPACVRTTWMEIWDSPWVPDFTNATAFPERHGEVAVTANLEEASLGAFQDVGSGGNTCRVFRPGRYTTPPQLNGHDVYFRSGDYVFDLPTGNSTILVRHGTVTAGKINATVTEPAINELSAVMTNQCKNAQTNDPSPTPGATFYLAGEAHIDVNTNGSFEIHARTQGPTLEESDYVSVQTLCNPNGTWCNANGNGGLAGRHSTLTAPSGGSVPPVLYTNSGNNKEFVSHAYFYAPLAQIEFGNVTNTASQKMLGGLVAATLVLQSSASASNFEISVPTSPITAEIQLTSTAIKDGTTTVQAVVEYRPYEDDIEERLRIKSWRVCDNPSCT